MSQPTNVYEQFGAILDAIAEIEAKLNEQAKEIAAHPRVDVFIKAVDVDPGLRNAMRPQCRVMEDGVRCENKVGGKKADGPMCMTHYYRRRVNETYTLHGDPVPTRAHFPKLAKGEGKGDENRPQCRVMGHDGRCKNPVGGKKIKAGIMCSKHFYGRKRGEMYTLAGEGVVMEAM